MYRNFLDHKWFLSGLAVIAWVLFANIFPNGYIILGGDVLQPINLLEKYQSFHYGWFLGRVSLFYGIFYLLSLMGVSETAQLSWYLGIFLFSAYISFYLFCRLIFPAVGKGLSVAVSLFYAMNIYTLYIFTATWGFTSFQILYVFIPLLTALYLKVLEVRNSRFIFLFLLVSALASVSFSNPAFALSLGIYFCCLTLGAHAFALVRLGKDSIKRIAILVLGSVCLNAYWMLPLLPQIQGGVQTLSTSTDVVLTERLEKTSNAVFDTIRLMTTSEQERYYPVNFPYPKISWLKESVVFLSFVPFSLILAGWFQKREGRDKKLYWLFFSMFTLFIVLVARVRYPFDLFNAFLFQLPGLNALRGWEKLAIYTPFLMSVLLLGVLASWQGKKAFKWVLTAFCLLAFLLALPYYAGGIQTKLSYILSASKKKDFKSASNSALIKIPKDYYAIREILAKDQSDSKISTLPFSPGSSVGRVGLPDLKVNGPHPARNIYQQKFLDPNDYYIPNWAFGEDIASGEYSPEWITDLYGLVGVRYVLYQHDAKPKALEKFEISRKYLEDKGMLRKLADNQSFALYELEEQSVFPYVYAASDVLALPLSPDGLSEKVRAFHGGIAAVWYEKENPREIIVRPAAEQKRLFLNEYYDPLWRAEYLSPQGERKVLMRDEKVKYANAWDTEEVASGGEVAIYYLPARLLGYGIPFSAGVLGLILLGTAVSFRRKDNLR